MCSRFGLSDTRGWRLTAYWLSHFWYINSHLALRLVVNTQQAPAVLRPRASTLSSRTLWSRAVIQCKVSRKLIWKTYDHAGWCPGFHHRGSRVHTFQICLTWPCSGRTSYPDGSLRRCRFLRFCLSQGLWFSAVDVAVLTRFLIYPPSGTGVQFCSDFETFIPKMLSP